MEQNLELLPVAQMMRKYDLTTEHVTEFRIGGVRTETQGRYR
jgi:hypothetical protein